MSVALTKIFAFFSGSSKKGGIVGMGQIQNVLFVGVLLPHVLLLEEREDFVFLQVHLFNSDLAKASLHACFLNEGK